MIKKRDLSHEDKKVWEDFIKNPSDIYDKDKNNLNNNRKQRYRFDLHGFSIEKANSTIEQIILKSFETTLFKKSNHCSIKFY